MSEVHGIIQHQKTMNKKYIIIAVIVAAILFIWWYKTRPYEIIDGKKVYSDSFPF
jgi:hypothetical protein